MFVIKLPDASFFSRVIGTNYFERKEKEDYSSFLQERLD